MGNNCSSSDDSGSDDGGGRSSKGSKHQMNPKQRSFIVECFKNDEIINKANVKDRLGSLIDALEYKEYDIGSYIFKEGDPGDKLFFLAFGSVDIISDSGKEYNTLKKGQIFGQYGFFNGKKRSASAMSTKASGVFSINQKQWNLSTVTQILHPKHLLQFDVFYDLTDIERAQIFSKLVRVEYKPNDVIVQSGDAVKGLYIVTNGEVVGSNNSVFGSNHHFGDLEIASNEKTFKNTYKASGSVIGITSIILIPLDVLKQQMPKVVTGLSKRVNRKSIKQQ